MADPNLIKPQQLCIGLFVQLDLPWMKHPFMSSSFKIRSEEQIASLKHLQLESLRIDPTRSDAEPLPLGPSAPVVTAPEPSEAEKALWEEKRQRIKVLKERRVRLNRCANQYRESLSSVRQLMDRLFSSPGQAVETANQVVQEMVGELTADQEVAIQLVNMKSQDENTYFHVINVAALSLVLGRKLGLKPEQLQVLGLGALFHDLGQQMIPPKVLRKKEALTPAEEQLRRRHTQYGVEMANKMGSLPPGAVTVMAQHHEYIDGSGFPLGLKRTDIHILAQIVGLVNRYDNLCNPVNGTRALSPYEAVSHLFAREKARFDPRLLQVFIANLGVYPPGTVVTLTDGRLGAVVSINSSELLKPNVLVYSPDVPREEALILNLLEEDIAVLGCLRRDQVKPEMLTYLSLTDQVSYYLERQPGASRRT